MKPRLSQSMIVHGLAGRDLLAYAHEHFVHPNKDAVVVEILEHKKPKSTSVGIFIDDVRELQSVVKTKRTGQKTIVLLHDAATMTVQTQVALLKLLEEPREDLYILLLTSSMSKLLDTIVSRCQVISIRETATVGDYDPQVVFMSKGIEDEAIKLSTDSPYRKKRQKQYELAKQFLGAEPYARLQIIISIQKLPRDEVIGFIDAAVHISGALLKSKPSVRIIRQTEILLSVGEALQDNGNIRTQLLRIVL